MFMTPPEYFKMVTDSLSRIPKSANEIKGVFEKVKNVCTTEATKASMVSKIYQKALTGDASVNEIADANKKSQELMVSARFAALMSIPGAVFMIPALSKIELNLKEGDLIPDSVKKEFNL